MSITMTLLPVLVLALVWLAVGRVLVPIQSRRNLARQFPAAIEPAGPFVECNVRFMPDEAPTRCIAEATPAGLYMVSTQESLAQRRWLTGPMVCYLDVPVLIPWSELKYQPSLFPLWGGIKFDVLSAKAVFYIRRKAAIELLRQGGRPIP
jgi:hypothetical protein